MHASDAMPGWAAGRRPHPCRVDAGAHHPTSSPLHAEALRVLRRDQERLHHDVISAPIRVLADFILTQPARPDIRIHIWAVWRTWARQSEVICNPTDTIPQYPA